MRDEPLTVAINIFKAKNYLYYCDKALHDVQLKAQKKILGHVKIVSL